MLGCLLPVWNLRAVILIPLSYLLYRFLFVCCQVLLLFLFCHFSANGPFSGLFFPENSNNFLLRIRLLFMALVEQLGLGLCQYEASLSGEENSFHSVCDCVQASSSTLLCRLRIAG